MKTEKELPDRFKAGTECMRIVSKGKDIKTEPIKKGEDNSTLQDRMQSEGLGAILSEGNEKPVVTEEYEEFDQKVFDEIQRQKEEKPIKKGYEHYL